MRQRTPYGRAGSTAFRTSHRPVNGLRKPVTERGRMALENSRRRLAAR